MRGGSQSYLIQGYDDRFYVAKFTGNPQGNRTLINEWIATHLLSSFDVSIPRLVLLDYDSSLLGATFFTFGNREVAVESGLHLGSLCPVSPERQAIFDFLPKKLLEKTINLEDFARMLVLDTFLHQVDRRQAIFVRARSGGGLAFRAFFIDHGMVFGGSAWDLNAPTKEYFYFDRLVYSQLQMDSICGRMISEIEALRENEIYKAVAELPPSWFSFQEYEALDCLVASLHTRKSRLRELVNQQLAEVRLHLPEPEAMHSVDLGAVLDRPLSVAADPIVELTSI